MSALKSPVGNLAIESKPVTIATIDPTTDDSHGRKEVIQ